MKAPLLRNSVLKVMRCVVMMMKTMFWAIRSDKYCSKIVAITTILRCSPTVPTAASSPLETNPAQEALSPSGNTYRQSHLGTGWACWIAPTTRSSIDTLKTASGTFGNRLGCQPTPTTTREEPAPRNWQLFIRPLYLPIIY